MSTPVSWKFLSSAANRIVSQRCELSVIGLERIPSDGPVIIAARHYHHLLDGAIIVSQIPRPSHIVVGLDWAGNPAISRAMRSLCMAADWPIVMRPDAVERLRATGKRLPNPVELRAMMRRAARDTHRLLAQGHVVIVFPEGYPNIDPTFTPKQGDEFLPFQPGVAQFARIAETGGAGNVPIVPLGLQYHRLDDKRWGVEATFGEALYVSAAGSTANAVRTLEHRVKALSGGDSPG